MHRFGHIGLKQCHDVENWLTGPTRSSEMPPLDTAHMTSY